jgi:hypothetical protein
MGFAKVKHELERDFSKKTGTYFAGEPFQVRDDEKDVVVGNCRVKPFAQPINKVAGL